VGAVAEPADGLEPTLQTEVREAFGFLAGRVGRPD